MLRFRSRHLDSSNELHLENTEGLTMKEYEVIWEIFNKCPRNQMRDVFVEELELEDPEEYVKNKFQGKEVSYEKTVLEDGTILFDIQTSQIKQRCSFTEI